MNQNEIGTRAASQLAQKTGWPIHFWGRSKEVSSDHPNLFDGQLQIETDSHTLQLPVEVKRNVRKARLPYLRERLGTKGDWVLIADYLSQPLQQELQANRINYLDIAGNAFIQHNELFILVEGRKSTESKGADEKIEFKPAELLLLFSFLIQPNLIQSSYRQLENRLGTSKATLSNLIRKLKQKKYLLGNPKDYQFRDTLHLLQEIAPLFHDTSKPQIMIQRFQFAKPRGHEGWQQWRLPPETRWGGEPAANLINGFLMPEEWTLYSRASIRDLLRALPIMPKSDGPISLYRQFWPADIESNPNLLTVPLPIIYADLMGSGIGRNRQAAEQLSFSDV